MTFDDIPRLLELLTPDDAEKHTPLLRAAIETQDIRSASAKVGLHWGDAGMRIGRLRAKYMGKRPSPKPVNPLDRLGLSSKFAWKEIRSLANSDKAPSVKIKALLTILEHQQKQLDSGPSGESAVKLQPILVGVVASEEEFEAFRTGGRFQTVTTQPETTLPDKANTI